MLLLQTNSNVLSFQLMLPCVLPARLMRRKTICCGRGTCAENQYHRRKDDDVLKSPVSFSNTLAKIFLSAWALGAKKGKEFGNATINYQQDVFLSAMCHRRPALLAFNFVVAGWSAPRHASAPRTSRLSAAPLTSSVALLELGPKRLTVRL